jgi:hypothetical protein
MVIVAMLVWFGLCALIIYGLTRPKVRAEFER